MKLKNLISISDLSVSQIEEIFVLADRIKSDKNSFANCLNGKTLALLFQKPSTRTRVSFEVGMRQLGGEAIYLGPEEVGLGSREATKDVAKVLSRYLDAIVARTYSHSEVLELAKYSTVPVINALTDLLHPCQALSDLYTIRGKKGKLKGLTISFVGDGNNVLHSLLYGCSKLGVNLRFATPEGYEPDKNIMKKATKIASNTGAQVFLTSNAEEAAEKADVLYTDVWVSMGQEKEREERLKAFKPYQVNQELVSLASPDVLVMHCLPAHRGEEITDDVLDGPHSIVLDQAENRLHLQKAILVMLLGGEE